MLKVNGITMQKSTFAAGLLFIVIMTASCKNSGSKSTMGSDKLVANYDTGILKEGIFKASYHVNPQLTTDQKLLLKKFTKILETDTIARRHFDQGEWDEIPPYHKNSGFSQQEYYRLTNLFTEEEPEKGNGMLTIIKDGDHFRFKGEGRLSLLDSVSINMKKRSALYKIYSLALAKGARIDLSGERIPAGDTLYRYEYYDGPDGILGLTGLEGEYELLLGKLSPGGKTYISFYAREYTTIEAAFPEYITLVLD